MKPKQGEIYSVVVNKSARYFQYLHDDSTQLNSNIVRFFKGQYELESNISCEKIQSSGVDFYAHVLIKAGIKHNLWKKYSQIDTQSLDDVWFRDSPDYGHPSIKITDKWWLWQANSSRQLFNKSTHELLISHVGIVISPDQILKRLETGSFQFFYPKYPNQVDL
jgi:hypothetical protein